MVTRSFAVPLSCFTCIAYLKMLMCRTASFVDAALPTSGIIQLQVISTIPLTVPIGGSLPWTSGAIDLAAASVNQKYAGVLNISIKYLYDTNDQTCFDTDATSQNMAAEYYYTRAFGKCVAFLTTCGGSSIATLPQLMTEWDVPMLTNGMGASLAKVNLKAAPTTTGMVDSYEGFLGSLLEFCRVFKWMDITALADSTSSSDFYRTFYDTVRLLPYPLSKTYSDLKLDSALFDPTSVQSMTITLRWAAGRSRVFLIFSHTLVAIKLLRTMKESRIAASPEEFAFIILQPSQQAAYGYASMFDRPDTKDESVFRSVIFVTTISRPGKDSADLSKEIIQRRNATYGTTFEKNTDPIRDLYSVRESYNSVELFAALVNESISNRDTDGNIPENFCSGRKLKTMMLNRTFSFPTGLVSIDDEGYRHSDLLFYAFHQNESVMKVAARFDSVARTFVWSANSTVTVDWFSAGIPLDVPVCGYLERDGPCGQSGSSDQARILAPVIVVSILLTAVIVLFLQRNCRPLSKPDRNWWRLNSERLIASIHVSGETFAMLFSTKALQNICQDRPLVIVIA